jgi:hypothetical protein
MNETLLSGRFLISLMQEVGRMTRGREVWIMNGVLGYCFQVRPKSLCSRRASKPYLLLKSLQEVCCGGLQHLEGKVD